MPSQQVDPGCEGIYTGLCVYVSNHWLIPGDVTVALVTSPGRVLIVQTAETRLFGVFFDLSSDF